MNTDKKKILIVSHGHPDINPGGGEIAAYNLFSALGDTEDHESLFFARHDKYELLHGGTSFAGTGSPNEVLFYAPVNNWFRFSQADHPKIWRDFRECLEIYQPDVVHFHHYVHLGIEMIREVKNYDENLPIVLTLHEFFAICHNHGQMVKTHGKKLCQKSSPSDCAGCFPEHTPQDFFLRKQFVKSHFELVDQFISPSQFLKNRYVEWGLDSEKIDVIENIDLSIDKQSKIRSKNTNEVTVFSYFGQINSFKGVDILVDAFEYLSDETKSKIRIEINGAGLDDQSSALKKHITLAEKNSKGAIRLKGKYERFELEGLMQSSDWIIVPSKWWENSPMVILEAHKYGVPVICSNIGGMAEKVRHLQDGLHFQMGRADSLADQIEFAVSRPELREKFSQSTFDHSGSKDDFDSHKKIYQDLLTARNKKVNEAGIRVVDDQDSDKTLAA